MDIKTLTGLELRHKLSEIVKRAAKGERFQVEMAGVPAILIVPHTDASTLINESLPAPPLGLPDAT